MNKLIQHTEEQSATLPQIASPVAAAHIDTVNLISVCEGIRNRRRRVVWLATALSAVTILVSGAINVSLAGRIAPFSFILAIFGTSLLAIAPMLCACVLMLMPSRKQSEALKQLAGTSDVNAVGALWEAQAYTEKSLRTAVSESLIRLLPQVKQQDPPLLTKHQILGLSTRVRNSVDPKLKMYYEEAMVIASIKAAAEVGGEDAIKHFEEVLNTTDESASVQRIKTEVEKCLPALRERYERESKGDKLLRPILQANNEHLLMPTTSQTTTNTNSLVRPLHTDKD